MRIASTIIGNGNREGISQIQDIHDGILAPFNRMANTHFRMVKLSVFRHSLLFPSSRLCRVGGGKTQQLADVVERDGDVGHDGRTCGRTGTHALVDYLRSDKAALLTGDFPVFPLSLRRTRRWNSQWERKHSLRKISRVNEGSPVRN